MRRAILAALALASLYSASARADCSGGYEARTLRVDESADVAFDVAYLVCTEAGPIHLSDELPSEASALD